MRRFLLLLASALLLAAPALAQETPTDSLRRDLVSCVGMIKAADTQLTKALEAAEPSEARTETVRSRAFVRGARTQCESKVLVAVDRLVGLPDDPTPELPGEPLPEPQPAEWAAGRWDLTVDGQPGTLDLDANTITLPRFGTLSADIAADDESLTATFDLGAAGAGSLELTLAEGRLTGTATAGGQSVTVIGEPERARPPPAPGEPLPPIEGTNEPAGLTVLGRNDGSVKEAGGSAFGIQTFGGWSSRAATGLAVVEDPSAPNGRALRFTYTPSGRGGGMAAAGSFGGGPFQTLYIRMQILHEPGGFEGWGMKWFYIGNGSGQPTKFYITREIAQNVRVIDQSSGSREVINSSDPAPQGSGSNPIAFGRWQMIETLFDRGTVTVWVDGRKVGEGSIPAPYDGMEWYSVANTVSQTSHYRLGELYIAGRR